MKVEFKNINFCKKPTSFKNLQLKCFRKVNTGSITEIAENNAVTGQNQQF